MHKLLALKAGELFGLFAGADETGSDLEFLLNSSSDAAFAGAVEFGNDEAIERHRFLEFAGLVEGVPACGGIDHEKCFMWSGFVLLANGALDLGKLLHEIVAGVKTTCGIAEQKIVVLADGALMGLIADGGRVGFVGTGDDGKVKAVTPADEMLDGCGPESVGGSEEDGVALALEKVAEFGGGSCFAGAIDADD